MFTGMMMLTERELKTLIKEFVRDAIDCNGGNLLLEMPLARKDYKNRLNDTLPQLFTRWCLVRYTTLSNNKDYRKHWQERLRGRFRISFALHCKNDDIDIRKKIIDELWKEYDYNDFQTIDFLVRTKFESERTTIVDSKEYKQCIMDFLDNADTIKEIILNRNDGQMVEYVNNEI